MSQSGFQSGDVSTGTYISQSLVFASPRSLKASPQPGVQSLPDPPPSTTCTSVGLQDRRLLLACMNLCPYSFAGIPVSHQGETGFAWNLPKSRLAPCHRGRATARLESTFLTLGEHVSAPSCPTSHRSCRGAQTGVSPGWNPSLRSKSFFWTPKTLPWFQQKCLYPPVPQTYHSSCTPHCCLVQ